MARKSRKNISEVVSSAAIQEEMKRPFRAGLYARISMETEETRERGTIDTQVELMKNFVADTEDISIADVYKDSDYSGTNFERPGFMQMMEDIKQGKINCVIVKDLSRLGRNYVETSNYIERVFPFFHVRFLAVTDDFDSFREGVDLTVPLKNIINEFYSKDLAKKSRSAKKALWKEGKFTSACEPYGYRKSEEDRHQLIVDKEAAEHLKKIFAILLDGKSGSAALDACIDRLNRLETTVTRPYFLEVLRLYSENKLTLAQVTEIFLTMENYLFRRTMCDLPTNALNKIFLMLHREIVRYDGTEDNYVEKLKYALLSKKERARFPDDEEFKAAFAERPVYLMNSKNKIYILERFENFGTSEDKDVYRHCDDGTYSIEHIMPQHLTPVWQKELGDDYEQIHELWLHRMANLTLTAYNSKYSNSSFTEKKTMQNGFDDSGIRMNTWIAKKDKWTLNRIRKNTGVQVVGLKLKEGQDFLE